MDNTFLTWSGYLMRAVSALLAFCVENPQCGLTNSMDNTILSWWRDLMRAVYALLALCVGNLQARRHCQWIDYNMRQWGFLWCELKESEEETIAWWIKCLTHYCLVMLLDILELGHHWFRLWLVAYSATSHYLNQWWLIIQKLLHYRNKWNSNKIESNSSIKTK